MPSLLGGILTGLLNKGTAEKEGTLLALEHACNCARDDEQYADLRAAAARIIGCDDARVRAVFDAIGNAAAEVKL
jgi:hypothetical protein